MNDEVAVAAADPALAAMLTTAFEEDLKRSKTWTAHEWRRRSVVSKAAERFWSLFSEIF
jgi:phosphatidylserine/phosphatidylglycerophosphate/cardiolipin synthase-like enzyme